MKWRRIGTAISTPMPPATTSQAKTCHRLRWTCTPAWGLAFSMSNAARSTHMNAVCPAAVPAVWTMLFSQRLNERMRKMRTTSR